MSDRRIISRGDAAAIVGITDRHMLRLHQEADPPPWTGVGYDCQQFGRWLRRQFQREAGVSDDGQVYDYAIERARLTKAQADKTELESAELRGEMARVPEIVEEWYRQTSAAKARLLSTPGKVAPRARAAATDEEASKLIEAEILEALQELSDDGLPERTRARRARGKKGVDAAAKANGDGMGGHVPPPESRKRRRARPLAH